MLIRVNHFRPQTRRTGATNRLAFGTKTGRFVVRIFFGFVTSQNKAVFCGQEYFFGVGPFIDILWPETFMRQAVLWPGILGTQAVWSQGCRARFGSILRQVRKLGR